MTIERILGAIVLITFLVGGFVYLVEPQKKVSAPVENIVAPYASSTAIEINVNATSVNKKVTTPLSKFLSPRAKAIKYAVAPDISSPNGFVNTDGKPVTISEFKNKNVVLLDIWTYSCINCQRTIPVLNELYKKYADQGLVIIGLHTPEFAFERIQKNVEDAVSRFGIKYPVVLDNDFSTWNAYKNRYWPRKYLIDIDGYIVYDHAGEGSYDETELAIQKALLERNSRIGIETDVTNWKTNMTGEKAIVSGSVGSPEIYFGALRNEYFENGKSGIIGSQALLIPEKINLNKLYLGGNWYIGEESAENKGGGEIVFKYRAENVYIVASGGEGTEIEVYRDDALFKTVHVGSEMLYTVIDGTDFGEHTLRIKIPERGSIEAFTFTFG